LQHKYLLVVHQLENQQAQTELAKARAVADEGLGVERLSRVEENRALAVERMAEAEKDREMALLNFVRALKEIEGIDYMHLEQLVKLSSHLKVEEATINKPLNEGSQQPLGS